MIWYDETPVKSSRLYQILPQILQEIKGRSQNL